MVSGMLFEQFSEVKMMCDMSSQAMVSIHVGNELHDLTSKTFMLTNHSNPLKASLQWSNFRMLEFLSRFL
jgi:hypothetical protein